MVCSKWAIYFNCSQIIFYIRLLQDQKQQNTEDHNILLLAISFGNLTIIYYRWSKKNVHMELSGIKEISIGNI